MVPIALAPGASFTLDISNVMIFGARGVLKVILGTGLGILSHGLLVGLGISKLLMNNTYILNFLKLFGIIFLLYLGIKLLLSGLRSQNINTDSLKPVSIKEAFLLNIFNVKALLFYLTVVPLFAGSHLINYVYLASLHTLTMGIWTFICGFLFVVAQEKFQLLKIHTFVGVIGGVCLMYLACVSAFNF